MVDLVRAGTVVDHYYFKISQGLGQYTPDRTHRKLRTIVARNDNRNGDTLLIAFESAELACVAAKLFQIIERCGLILADSCFYFQGAAPDNISKRQLKPA